MSWIFGAHIEMTTKPAELIPDEAPSHPDGMYSRFPIRTYPSCRVRSTPWAILRLQEGHRDFVIFPKPAREQQPFAPPSKIAAYQLAPYIFITSLRSAR